MATAETSDEMEELSGYVKPYQPSLVGTVESIMDGPTCCCSVVENRDDTIQTSSVSTMEDTSFIITEDDHRLTTPTTIIDYEQLYWIEKKKNEALEKELENYKRLENQSDVVENYSSSIDAFLENRQEEGWPLNLLNQIENVLLTECGHSDHIVSLIEQLKTYSSSLLLDERLNLSVESNHLKLCEEIHDAQLESFEKALKERSLQYQSLMERVAELEEKLNSIITTSNKNQVIIVDPKEAKAACTIQRAFRLYRKRRHIKQVFEDYISQPKAKNLKKRNGLISEIVQTEETYVKSLTLVEKLYINPLKNAESDLERFNLTFLEVQKIFNNLTTILSMHKLFLMNLKQRLDDWQKVYIGDCFVNQSFFFLFYVEYVNGYNEASNTLRELRQKNKEFNLFLNETKKNRECKGLSLESFLILPIQR